MCVPQGDGGREPEELLQAGYAALCVATEGSSTKKRSWYSYAYTTAYFGFRSGEAVNKTAKYVIGRILFIIPIMLILSFFVFALTYLSPSDPVSDPEIRREIRRRKMKLEIQEITYSINGKLIVDGVDLGIEEGTFVGLVGPNGCGKTTLLKCIYRTYQPDSGVVYIDGNPTTHMHNRELAREMSVMQQENIVEFDMTVFDMVMLGRFAHQKMFGNDMLHERELVREALKEVGMENYEERSFLSLSGGEKQRTLVARALVLKAALILLDEPTNHLDIGFQYQIMSILKKTEFDGVFLRT